MKKDQKPEEIDPIFADLNETLLEKDQRLSQSLIWALQRRFFEQEGVKAWSKHTIPHNITNNPFIAQAYSHVVFAFFRDCQAAKGKYFPAPDHSQPMYIIEFGAGTGRFAYYFLRDFAERLEQSVLKGTPFKYILTDFNESNLKFWQAHPKLTPFVEQGLLDFALFDSEKDCELTLHHSKEKLAPGTLKNPLVCLANYFFDSIPQDAFYIEDGKLHESLMTLYSTKPDPDKNDPELLNHLNIYGDEKPVTALDYYDDPLCNEVLECYQQNLNDAYILFPTAAIQCIRTFSEIAQGRVLFLSGDKGDSREQDLLRRNRPKVNRHGSISFMVNYHAIGQYVEKMGGQALSISHRHRSLNVGAFLLGKHPKQYIETRQAYRENIEQKSPDDFYSIKKIIDAHTDAGIRELMAWMRMSGYNHSIFSHCVPRLSELVQKAPSFINRDLREIINNVWESYYPIGEPEDLANDIAIVLSAMFRYEEALSYLQHTLQDYGATATTFYNMAMCYYGMEDADAALEYVNKALEQNPELKEALSLKKVLQPADVPDVKSFFRSE